MQRWSPGAECSLHFPPSPPFYHQLIHHQVKRGTNSSSSCCLGSRATQQQWLWQEPILTRWCISSLCMFCTAQEGAIVPTPAPLDLPLGSLLGRNPSSIWGGCGAYFVACLPKRPSLYSKLVVSGHPGETQCLNLILLTDFTLVPVHYFKWVSSDSHQCKGELK